MSELQLNVLMDVQEEEMVQMEVNESEKVEVNVAEGLPSGTTDYNDLTNKPKLNGKVIQGEMAEEDPTVPEWAKNDTKPAYSPSEIGAVNVNNTVSLKDIDEMFKQVFGK